MSQCSQLYSQPTDGLLTDEQLVRRHQVRAGFLRTEPIDHQALRGGHLPLRWYELDGCLASGSMDMLDICRLFNISPNNLHSHWVPAMATMLHELANYDTLASSGISPYYCVRDAVRGIVVDVDKMITSMPQLARILPYRRGTPPAENFHWPPGYSNSFIYPRVQDELSLFKIQDFLLEYAKDYMAVMKAPPSEAHALAGTLAEMSIQA